MCSSQDRLKDEILIQLSLDQESIYMKIRFGKIQDKLGALFVHHKTSTGGILLGSKVVLMLFIVASYTLVR